QAFLLVPEQDHWYQADVHNPWEYWWLGFAAPPVATLQQWLGVTELSSVLLVQDRARFRAAYRDLWSLLRVFDRPTPPLALMEKLIVVLRSLIAGKHVSPHDAHSDAASTADLRWQRVCAFVEAHYCEPMTIDAICRATGTSRAELHRTVAQATGSAPMRYVTDLRMRRAADLLQEPNRPIGRIAHLVGYREYQTFVREFKRYYRVSPREFRRISSPDLRKR
ncbi:MAG: AraC family transcriptional regulator, partial [Cytophagales bacterium]|nr:AraC family transcriptional regulator [Cytophagales bacterium]